MSNEIQKKPFYKKAWFWGIIVVLGIIGSFGNREEEKIKEKSMSEKVTTEKVTTKQTTKETEDESAKKDRAESRAKKKEERYRKSVEIIDEMVDKYQPVDKLMTIDDFNNFAVNGFTLDGAIASFGRPSHVIGGAKGDVAIEVTYPTDEEGFSIGLKFSSKDKRNGMSDWFLTEKYSVKTDGIRFSEYIPRK